VESPCIMAQLCSVIFDHKHNRKSSERSNPYSLPYLLNKPSDMLTKYPGPESRESFASINSYYGANTKRRYTLHEPKASDLPKLPRNLVL
jgi:hypothetical protein